MAKKKLLSEAQVRRFMGLAGVDATLSSNALKEMYSMKRDDEEKEEEKMEEAMYAEEEPAADEEMPPADGMDAEEPADAAEEPADAAEVEISPEDIKDARAAVEKLLAPLEASLPAGEEADAEEPAPAMDADAPADDLPADEPAEEEDEEVMESLSGINLELTEDELVQEVAKRVSQRLLRAKKAQLQLDEALGRKSTQKK